MGVIIHYANKSKNSDFYRIGFKGTRKLPTRGVEMNCPFVIGSNTFTMLGLSIYVLAMMLLSSDKLKSLSGVVRS